MFGSKLKKKKIGFQISTQTQSKSVIFYVLNDDTS